MYNAYTQEAMESCFHGRLWRGVWKCILFHWFVLTPLDGCTITL